jgi:hypothetical protein
MIGLTGLGQVNLLSGRIRRYRVVGFRSATRCAPVNLLGRGAGRLGCVSHARVVRPAGLHRIRPEANFQLINSFFFKSVLKITNQFEFKSNLNFNDFYSHNKLQEHFINPRKICNGMNATINYKNLNGFNNFRK